jgi:hypothetical protein
MQIRCALPGGAQLSAGELAGGEPGGGDPVGDGLGADVRDVAVVELRVGAGALLGAGCSTAGVASGLEEAAGPVGAGVGVRVGVGAVLLSGTEVVGAGLAGLPVCGLAPDCEAGRTRKYAIRETTKTAASAIVDGRTATCARHQSRTNAVAVGVHGGRDGDAFVQHGASDPGA